MDKQNQIEEMAKDMLDFGTATYPTSDSVFTEQKLREQFYQVFLAYAEHLVYKGYCKILEGAVVLTREEYDDMFTFKTVGNAGKHCGFYNILDTVRKVERKKTAEKFAEMVSKAFIGLNCIDIDEWNWCQNKIDEIAKGIIDGK